MEFTLAFIHYFLMAVYLTAPLLILFFLIILTLGQIVGRIESWDKFNAFYWSFITAFTVGYGDIRPLKISSKIISIFIALTGILFTGILVAITVATATMSFEDHIALFKNG